MFSLFILLVIIRLMNKHLDNDKFSLADNPNVQNGNVENYYPFVFHAVIIILIIISFINANILTADRIGVLISDGIFQFVSTLLILMISIINPFIPISPSIKQKLEEGALTTNSNWLLWFTKGRNWQITKSLVCILIITYFIHSGYLAIPSLNQGPVSVITILLIVFFVFGNVAQLIRNPVLFKKKTLFRLSMLYRSIKLSFLISIGLIAIVFIFGAITKIDTPKYIKAEVIVLIVYNVVMATNEYKILRARA